MASNSQIVANISSNRRPGKWILPGIIIAALLVTLPVLPLRFIGIPGPDFDWISRAVISKFGTGAPPATINPREKPDAEQPPAGINSSDIKLMDVTVSSLLKQISEHPNDPSFYNRIGLINAEIGAPHAAVTNFEQAIRLCREQIKELKAKSNLARAQGDISTACDCTLKVSGLNVQLAAAHSSLARVYEQLGKSDKVMGQLNELGKDISLSKVIVPNSPNETARVENKERPIAGSKNGSSLDSETAALLARADALRQTGRVHEAMQEYKRLIERLPNLTIAHKELGMTAISMRDLWTAKEELTRASLLNSKDATVYSALAGISKELGQNEKAEQEYEKAVALEPKDVNSAFALGNLYAEDCAYGKAIAAFQKAVAARPDFAGAHNNLATMYSLNEQYADAIHEFQQTILLSPTLASAHYGLGVACLNERHYKESVRAFKRALALNPDLVDAHNKLELARKKLAEQEKIY